MNQKREPIHLTSFHEEQDQFALEFLVTKLLPRTPAVALQTPGELDSRDQRCCWLYSLVRNVCSFVSACCGVGVSGSRLTANRLRPITSHAASTSRTTTDFVLALLASANRRGNTVVRVHDAREDEEDEGSNAAGRSRSTSMQLEDLAPM